MFKILDLVFRVKRKVMIYFFSFVFSHYFKSIGKKSILFGPFRVDGNKFIKIGSNTIIQKNAWLYCIPAEGKTASLRIGNNCVFGYNNHITSVCSVEIGDFVLTANNVYISDNVHSFESIDIPILLQPVIFKSPVFIGSGTWIGENVSIIGASVGRNCVIGANSVVTKNIPDYSVAVGIPAKVIKTYDIKLKCWVKVN
uniref:DapH/DapD/GlmU-related protein n=1 Tax=Algoriphagus sp. TaxID=1872435 RepID=UPI00404839CE